MNKKIIGIVVLMLVTTTVVSATNINVKKTIKQTSAGIDAPVWEKGDSWTYNEQYHQIFYNKNGDIYYTWFHNCTCTYTVIADTEESYTLKMTSKNNEGSLTFGLFRLKFTPFVKFTQEIQCRKTDLGYINCSNQEKGPAFWLLGKIGLPIPTQYSDTWEVSFTPAWIYLPFPFTAGTNGILPGYNETGQEKMGLYWGLIKFFDVDFSNNVAACNYTCEMADISVPAGNYNAYNISTDEYFGSSHNYTRLYYVPDLGYIAKNIEHLELDDSGKPLWDYKVELKSTTYTQ
jgi:hypothetical protein